MQKILGLLFDLSIEVKNSLGFNLLCGMFVALIASMDYYGQNTLSFEGITVEASTVILTMGVMLWLCGSGINFILTRVFIATPLLRAGKLAQEMRDGDLSQEDLVFSANDEIGRLYHAQRAMRKGLKVIVAKLHAAARQVAEAAHSIALDTSKLSEHIDGLGSGLQTSSSALEQLTSTVKQNASNAKQASTLAGSASEIVLNSKGSVMQMVETMETIHDSSKKIVDIIAVIDGIAFQTNILALNAAVEAARAGEQGRGFAVVASEVRSLAQRSAVAAKEIKSLIVSSVEEIDRGTIRAHEAGNTMEEVVSSVKRVADIVQEITAASIEQAQGIEEINGAIAKMDRLTQENVSLVTDMAQKAEQLKDYAKATEEVASVFKTSKRTNVPAKANKGMVNTPDLYRNFPTKLRA